MEPIVEPMELTFNMISVEDRLPAKNDFYVVTYGARHNKNSVWFAEFLDGKWYSVCWKLPREELKPGVTFWGEIKV